MRQNRSLLAASSNIEIQGLVGCQDIIGLFLFSLVLKFLFYSKNQFERSGKRVDVDE
jgi:hypothetical protein